MPASENSPSTAASSVHNTSRKWYPLNVLSPTKAIKDRFLKYAGELRFPKLVMLTVAIFALDLVVPDFIPFVDEILLGLLAALLSTFKKNRRATIEVPPAAPADAPPDLLKRQ